MTYGLYRLCSFRWQNLVLLAASYIFYGWWNIHFLYWVILSTYINFYCGAMIDAGRLDKPKRWLSAGALIGAALLFNVFNLQAIQVQSPLAMTVNWGQLLQSLPEGIWLLMGSLAWLVLENLLYPQFKKLPTLTRRKWFLGMPIFLNLLLLGYFKYVNFFVDSLEAAIRSLGGNMQLGHLSLILPLGISFYTFKAISYICDIYAGKIQATAEFTTFSLFFAYFPPLVAGPIDRGATLLPQLAAPRQINFQQTIQGLFLILFGLFKKVAIADGLSGSVNAIYASTEAGWLNVVAATVLYALQIYCDFCGYSDIARGVSKLFGIELMLNFNLPYFSKDPSEFWRRWHISLSTWLRDYLYIPLGGNRKGNFRTYINLMTTMVLGGLWHGASWNFILWGFYQGFLLCLYRLIGNPILPALAETLSQGRMRWLGWLGNVVNTAVFFGLTCYGWLLFRATSLAQVVAFTQTLFFGFGDLTLTVPKPPLATMLGLPILIGYEIWEYASQNPDFRFKLLPPVRAAFYAALLIVVLMGQSNAPAQFIYSQF
jgi:D-alanyl-lipoteichoic acid acyltransferase DltB (MBOAT superfamily)